LARGYRKRDIPLEALATAGELAMRKVILFVQVSLDGFFEWCGERSRSSSSGPVGISWSGEGKRLFPPSKEEVQLRLAETRTFGNGVVLLRYERLRPRGGS
jgi:hypothetical protein